MELDLSKPEKDLLAQVGVSGGLRRRKRGGVDPDEDEAPAASSAVRTLVEAGAAGALTDPQAKGPATAALVALETGGVTKTSDEEVKRGAKAAIIHVLKFAYDKGTQGVDLAIESAKKAGQAGLYAGTAGGVLYVVDSAFRAGLCDPLAMALSKSVAILPAAMSYSAQCDASLVAYNTAISAALVLVSPLILKAVNKVASIAVSEETLDAITDRVIKLTTPGAAERVIKDAIEERERSKAAVGTKRRASEEPASAYSQWALPSAPKQRRGGKKTKKRVSRSRVTRRKALIFSY